MNPVSSIQHPVMHHKGLLWKIEGESLPSPSYLFGTMHVRDRRAFTQLEIVYEKMMDCQGYAAEFHLDEHLGVNEAFTMQLPEGQLLSSFFSPKEFKRYHNLLLKSTSLDLDNFERMLPFVVMNLATEHLLSMDMPDPLDQHLWQYAKQMGRSLHGIETFQEQMAVLAQIPLETQVKMLGGLCSNVGKFRHYLRRLAAHYEAGELKLLYKMVKRNTKDLRHLMLYQRNEIMAERIADLIQQQSAFISIGAAHLSGGKGVLRLLKKKGFSTRPIGA
ncbi:MAG: TraB/GumN family protein [Saprospiraceae bacterium]|nr:TraB/GumN family protein [Saprospiraceae bacterium]